MKLWLLTPQSSRNWASITNAVKCHASNTTWGLGSYSYGEDAVGGF